MSAPWGRPYGGDLFPWVTTTGARVQMRRKGVKVRFYDAAGVQHGPEQANVWPAMCAAYAAGWDDTSTPAWLNDGCRRELAR